MGISGRVAAGVQDSLAKMLAEQLAAQIQQQQIAQGQQRIDLDREALSQRAKSDDEDRKLRGRQLDQQDTDRRDANNTRGVRRMSADFILQRNGSLNSDDKRGLAALQIEADGNFDPRLLQEPEDPNAGIQRELQTYEAKRQIDAKYERPAAAAKPERDPIADYDARKAIDAKYAQQANAQTGNQADETRRRILEIATNLRNAPGRESLTGNRVLNPSYGLGFTNEPVAGTDAANAQALFDSLKSVMTLENLGLLKGALSDKDIAFLKSAGSALNTSMPDPDFLRELESIIAKAQSAGAAVPEGANQMQRSGAAPRRMRFDAKGNPIP
jgi:hypothetical protein